MLNIRVLLNQTDLVLVHKTVYVSALIDEARSKELGLSRLESDQDVENRNYQVVGFVGTCVLLATAYRRHDVTYDSVNSDQLEDGTGDISDVFKLLKQFLEQLQCRFIVAWLLDWWADV